MERKIYSVTFEHSKDNKSWTSASFHVRAESEQNAVEKVKRRYPHIRDIRVLRVS